MIADCSHVCSVSRCGHCNSVPENVGHHRYTFIYAFLLLQVMLSVCS